MSGIHQMLFAGGAKVELPATFTADDTSIDPATALAGIRLRNDGLLWWSDAITAGTWASYATQPKWLTNGNPANYDAWVERLSGTGDTLEGSAENTWLNLGTTRDWSFSTSGVDQKNAYIRIKIRNATTLVEVADTGTGNTHFIQATQET